jgi:DNA-binding NarL/FixJ family response regulator
MAEIELLARRARLALKPSDSGGRETSPTQRLPWDHLGLTEREIEVLRYVAEGLTNRQIAERLFISPKTASVHVTNILRKLGLKRRVEAATLCFQMGLSPRTGSK